MNAKHDPNGSLWGHEEECRLLAAGSLWDPHRVLGAHPATIDGRDGALIRLYHPEATAAQAVLEDGRVIELRRWPHGPLFAGFVPGARLPLRYRRRFTFAGGQSWEGEDPYRFLPTVGEVDQYLLGEGTHRRLWDVLGAHVRTLDGVEGVSFAVWAPNARRVSVVGDFCHWDGRQYPMRVLGQCGVFELFVPGLRPGAAYKYEIKTQTGALRIKTDPVAFALERPPGTTSRVYHSTYRWGDDEWMIDRARHNRLAEPMAAYEVHLDSWARVPEEDNRPLTYREIAPRLIAHVKRLGFNWIEFMPLAEYPFDGSWGYQVTGYFAPTSRYGTPDDFRYLVDQCHQAGLGVILDWVPAHFPKDDFALRLFDGTPLYEHSDWRHGEHPDWGTLIFNYGRNEVRNFLIGSALYWLKELHVDGLRVDAVASMLYLDYSRGPGEWIPNEFGGNENLDAIRFLRQLNEAVGQECPGCVTIAEESTAFGGVSRPANTGGLGFWFKWNMGWMHDTLLYFSKDPIHRKHHQDQLTFAMIYEYSENFVMPLSHDEVVHGKGSLLSRMPGDAWQKFANLRALLGYQFTRPGKKLLFMGTELAPYDEWDYRNSLPWHLAADPDRQGLQAYMEALGRLYHDCSCFWRRDHDPDGFSWIDLNDRESSVLIYARHDPTASQPAAAGGAAQASRGGERTARGRETARRGRAGRGEREAAGPRDDASMRAVDVGAVSSDVAAPAGDARRACDLAIVALNLTPIPREGYRVGVPRAGWYAERLNSDAREFGGSGYPTAGRHEAEPTPWHGRPYSIVATLPPLSMLVLMPALPE